jgi:hypothetical protein
VNLTQLYCAECPLLTSIPATLNHLTVLDCSECHLIASLPTTLTHLRELNCQECMLLTSISATLVNLTMLHCSGCPLLTNIPAVLDQLMYLYCINCPKLTHIPVATVELHHEGCTWLDQSNQAVFLKVKNKLMRYFYFKRWIRTKEFMQWFYHPDNFGGYKHKLQLQRLLEAQIETAHKKQRLE